MFHMIIVLQKQQSYSFSAATSPRVKSRAMAGLSFLPTLTAVFTEQMKIVIRINDT